MLMSVFAVIPMHGMTIHVPWGKVIQIAAILRAFIKKIIIHGDPIELVADQKDEFDFFQILFCKSIGKTYLNCLFHDGLFGRSRFWCFHNGSSGKFRDENTAQHQKNSGTRSKNDRQMTLLLWNCVTHALRDSLRFSSGC